MEMIDLDGLYAWMFIVFDTTPEKAKEIKELVAVINELFTAEKMKEIEERVVMIKDLSDDEFNIVHAMEVAGAVKDVVQILVPFFKELRDVISTDRANHLKENLSTFIQVVIMMALYKHRENINTKALSAILPGLSDVAAVTLKIKSSGRVVKFIRTIVRYFGCAK